MLIFLYLSNIFTFTECYTKSTTMKKSMSLENLEKKLDKQLIEFRKYRTKNGLRAKKKGLLNKLFS
ncbi:hypothetical protein GCM10023163_30410 [Aestuariibaculum suncheonense]